MKIEIEINFQIGDKVAYDNKIGRDCGTVTGINLRSKQHRATTYCVSWSDKKESWHYDYELKPF